MYGQHLTEQIISAAIEVHRGLGPGLLESAYQPCLMYEFARKGLSFEAQSRLAVTYKEVTFDDAYRMDFVIEGKIVIEVKAVERLQRIHIAQLITYLKLGNYPVGLLLNFNVELMKDGIRRVTNNNFPPHLLLSSL
jgi:GxxExxY protein